MLGGGQEAGLVTPKGARETRQVCLSWGKANAFICGGSHSHLRMRDGQVVREIFLGGGVARMQFLPIEIRAAERVECSREAGNPAAHEKGPGLFGGADELLLVR